MPGSRQKKKKKTGKKGGGAKAERPETAERTEAQKEKDDAKNWVELEKQELAHMDEKMAHDPNWLAFSLAKAPWLNFSIDKAIDTALDDSYIGGSDEVVARWMHRAESSVIYWIINKIIEREGRAELFRSLGRGWIFILLRRPQRKFKWWFEGVNRVIRNHQSDIKALNLPEGGLEKYTQGYVCQSEIVFLMKGLTPTRIVPIISIQKMANDFEHLHKWATNEDARKAVQTPFPTDEERQAHAAKAQKRQERNRREKEKKRERAKRAKEERAKEEEKAKQGEQAQEDGRATAGEAEAAAGGVAGSEDDDDAVAGVVGAGAPTAAGLSDPEEEEDDDDDEEDDGGGFASRGGLLDEGASLSFEAMLAAMKAEDAMASPAVEETERVSLIDAVSTMRASGTGMAEALEAELLAEADTGEETFGAGPEPEPESDAKGRAAHTGPGKAPGAYLDPDPE